MSFIRKLESGINISQNITTNKKIHYVVEDGYWAIYDVGVNLIQYITEMRVTKSIWGIKNSVIHFGSFNTIPNNIDTLKKISQNNTLIATIFHIDSNDPRKTRLEKIDNYIERWHTSCLITRNILIENGIDKKKITVIPLGVNLNHFSPVTPEEKKEKQKKLCIRAEKKIIGSFQKDGNGWGEGLDPKKIKGPDIFLDVVANLKKDYDIHCLLSGPARGFIKKGLEKMNVTYTHKYYEKPWMVAECYQASDLYLMTSRVEGGPKSILESLASGVPLVATKVGMAPDILTDEYDSFLIEPENVSDLTDKTKILLENSYIAKNHINNGLNTIQQYSWDKIAGRYQSEIYSMI